MEPETQLTWTGSIPDCPAWVLEASHECSKHLRNKGFDSLSGETPFCVSAENTCTVVPLREKRDTSQNWNDSEPHPYMVDILPSLSLSVAYIIVYCLWLQLVCCWFEPKFINYMSVKNVLKVPQDQSSPTVLQCNGMLPAPKQAQNMYVKRQYTKKLIDKTETRLKEHPDS